MSSKLTYTVQQNPPAILVSGPTFDHKEKLKSLGATWDPSRKLWLILNQTLLDSIKLHLEPPVNVASFGPQQRVEARAKKAWENSPEGKRARVLEALQSGKHTWICCGACEVVDWKNKVTHCAQHGFRVRYCQYDGT